MRGYAHSNCKYLRVIEMHDYDESKTVLTINDNHELKVRMRYNFCDQLSQMLFVYLGKQLRSIFYSPNFDAIHHTSVITQSALTFLGESRIEILIPKSCH